MIPTLFEQEETDFSSNGIGRLSDATRCVVTERLNDFYSLELEYPATGVYANEILPGRLIFAKPNDVDNPQPFRIYEVDRTLRGIITARANHISYDLCGYFCRNITGVTTAAGAIAALKSREWIDSGFSFSTDLSVTANWEKRGAFSVRSAMGGDGSILDTYGGEWHFNVYECELLEHRGTDSGVSIRYGTNMTDLEDVLDDANDYTGVFTYYFSSGTYVSCTDVVYLDEYAVPQRILVMDHTSDFQSTPTKAQLDALASADLSLIAGAERSITVSFVPTIEHLQIGDYVTVVYGQYGIQAKLEVVQTEYNVLINRNNAVELGAIRQTLSDIIAGLK